VGNCQVRLTHTVQKTAFKKGNRVVWLPDSEEGFVAEVSESSLCVEWEEYGICWYPINLIAATERIAAVAARPGSPKLFSA
jgi:hypothetical protein